MATNRGHGFATESGRLEAFSDGVIAVIITIMVLDLRAPAGDALHDLGSVAPTFAAYILSFVFVGIYWNNHHHMLRASAAVYGAVLLMDAIAYTILQSALAAVNGPESPFVRAVGVDRKGKASLLLYLAAIGAAFVVPAISDALYVVVAVMWLVPDRRFHAIIAVPDQWGISSSSKPK